MCSLLQIMRAASLDNVEMADIMSSLHSTLVSKNAVVRDLHFQSVRLAKRYNETRESVYAQMSDLGVAQDEIVNLGFEPEVLLLEASTAQAGLTTVQT
jgi:hypothetical protein